MQAHQAPKLPSKPRLVYPPNFDPQKVPTVQTDGHLPFIAPDKLTLASFRRAFSSHSQQDSLALQSALMQAKADDEPTLIPSSPLAAAAVLICLEPRDSGLALILTQRSPGLHHHPNQIAFPGGRCDPSDADIFHTALREAQEEIALNPQNVEVLGALMPFATASGYLLHPVVAAVNSPQSALQPNPTEVQSIFRVPVDFLMNPKHHHHHSITTQYKHQTLTRHWLSMPFEERTNEQLGGQPIAPITHFIWGITARLIRCLYDFMVVRLPQI